MSEKIAESIREVFTSDYGTIVDAIVDSLTRSGENGDQSLVGEISELSLNAKKIANAITPLDAVPSADATGGHVRSLTEAVMGMTAGLVKIADSIQELAYAVAELKGK